MTSKDDLAAGRDPAYLTCPVAGHHELGDQPDANGIVTCQRCGWRAAPAWIVQCIVNLKRAMPFTDAELGLEAQDG